MNIQMRLDPEIHDAAKQAAALEGVSVSEYLRKLLERNLEQEGAEEEAKSTGQRVNGESSGIR
jgi:hypothetical protein